MSEPRPVRETIHVAAAEDVTSPGDTSEAFASEVDRLAEEFRSRLRSAAVEAEASVRHDVTDRLEKEFDEKFNAGIRLVRQEMERRMEDAQTKWDKERDQLNRHFTELIQTTDAGRVYAEIQKTEAALAKVAEQVESMVEDANVRLSEVMRKKAEHAEIRAYLRGLKSRAGDNVDDE